MGLGEWTSEGRMLYSNGMECCVVLGWRAVIRICLQDFGHFVYQDFLMRIWVTLLISTVCSRILITLFIKALFVFTDFGHNSYQSLAFTYFGHFAYQNFCFVDFGHFAYQTFFLCPWIWVPCWSDFVRGLWSLCSSELFLFTRILVTLLVRTVLLTDFGHFAYQNFFAHGFWSLCL